MQDNYAKDINQTEKDNSTSEYNLKSISYTPNKLNFLKTNWMSIYTPLILKNLEIRMNLSTLTIDLRIKKEFDPIFLERGGQFLQSILMGFPILQSVRILDEEIQIIKYKLEDVRKMNPNTMSRAIGRIVGKNGTTKKLIEECSNSLLIISDNCITLFGTHKDIKMAKESIRRLVAGKSVGSVHKNLKKLKAKEKREFFETIYAGKDF